MIPTGLPYAAHCVSLTHRTGKRSRSRSIYHTHACFSHYAPPSPRADDGGATKANLAAATGEPLLPYVYLGGAHVVSETAVGALRAPVSVGAGFLASLASLGVAVPGKGGYFRP